MGDLDPPETDPSPPRRTLLGLFVLGLAVRVAFLWAEPATHLAGDERTWTDWAGILLSERVGLHPLRSALVFYPPVYPYFIAALLGPFGTLGAVKWAQVVVSAAIVPALGRVAGAAFGSRAGVAAAAIAAVYPELVWFSVHFWSETVFMALLWWAFERLLAADRRGRVPAAVAAGVLWGLAVLTRETALYFVPLAAAWLAWRRPGGTRRGLVFAAAALLTVAPWTWRNWLKFHAFVPVSTAGGLNLYQGNAPLTRQEVYDRYEAVSGRIEQYRWARREGLRAIVDRQPAWLFEKLRDEMPKFWEADSLALIHIKRGAYGEVGVGAARLAALTVLLPYLAALALFPVGLSALRPGRVPLLLLGFLAYYNALHVVTHGFARYRLPVLPVVLMVAAWAGVAVAGRSLPALGPRRRALLVLLATLALATLIPSLRMNYAHPAFGFVATGAPPAGE